MNTSPKLLKETCISEYSYPKTLLIVFIFFGLFFGYLEQIFKKETLIQLTCMFDILKHISFGLFLYHVIFWITIICIKFILEKETNQKVSNLQTILLGLSFSILLSITTGISVEVVEGLTFNSQIIDITADTIGILILFIYYSIICKKACFINSNATR